jgi:hypothetical protein
MLPSQIIAGFLLATALAFPLVLRYTIVMDGISIINTIIGALFVVSLAVCMGILSGGKKLFEVIFFLLTYTLVNGMALADYMGSLPQHHNLVFTGVLSAIILALLLISFAARKYQAGHL